jgi:hypothetical protein
MQLAALPQPPRFVGYQQQKPQLYAAVAPAGRGFHLIQPAAAETLPHRGAANGGGSGNWSIQVGAFVNEGAARAAAEAARGHTHELASAHSQVGAVKQAKATLYRARVTGLSRDAAVQACEKLSHGHGSCVVVSPES